MTNDEKRTAFPGLYFELKTCALEGCYNMFRRKAHTNVRHCGDACRKEARNQSRQREYARYKAKKEATK